LKVTEGVAGSQQKSGLGSAYTHSMGGRKRKKRDPEEGGG